MGENLIEVSGLSKKFCLDLKRSLFYGLNDIGYELLGMSKHRSKLRKKEFWALNNVSFNLKKGELLGLIGPNGAGKTTLLKLLTGIIKPDKGQIKIRGKMQALIALGAGFNPILTGRENIYVNGAILGFSKKKIDEIIDEIIDFSEIGDFIDMPVQSYSSGMHVRLGFSVAVNLKPDILIVDEVLAVGDVSFKRKARNKMMSLLHSGISVIFVSHNMALISSITSRSIYINKGEIISIGSSDKIVSLYLNDSMLEKREKSNSNDLMALAFLTNSKVFVLKKIDFLNSNVLIIDTISYKTFDDIKVKIEFELKKDLKNVSFAIGVREITDDVVMGFNKKEFSSLKKGVSTIEFCIKENRLREGNYSLGFYAADYNGGALFKSHNIGSFVIETDIELINNSGSSQGLFVFDASWKIQK